MPPARTPPRLFRDWRWAWPAAFVSAGVVLFGAYLRQSYTATPGSDGAVIALQAWDMLHGNLLLRGWTLPDMTFYTIELPEFMLLELARGLSITDVHIVEALNYTLLVLLSALLAKGGAGGREGVVRALVAAGILLAPTTPGVANTVAFANPDHLGTQLLLLVAWLILDRARPHWWVPVVVAVLLAWAQVSDSLVLIEGVLPLLVVSVVRLYRQRRGPLRAQWYDLSLAAAAIAANFAANLTLRMIREAGGFRAYPLNYTFAYVDTLYSHIWLTVETVLALFGADFSGQRLIPNIQQETWIALLHLIGVALVCWALAIAVRRYMAHDRVVQLLTMAVAVTLLIYTSLIGFDVGGGAHDILPVLPFGAVLAGRLLADQLIRRGLVAALALALACYVGVLAHNIIQPSRADDGYHRIAGWLQARHFSYGLSDYWAASLVDLDTGNRVQVVPVKSEAFQIVLAPWNSEASWYNPRLHDASFFILPDPMPGCSPGATRGWVKATRNAFGPPANTYTADGFLVLVWHKNLLRGHLIPLPMARPGRC
jgi:hypothetical protein